MKMVLYTFSPYILLHGTHPKQAVIPVHALLENQDHSSSTVVYGGEVGVEEDVHRLEPGRLQYA